MSNQTTTDHVYDAMQTAYRNLASLLPVKMEMPLLTLAHPGGNKKAMGYYRRGGWNISSGKNDQAEISITPAGTNRSEMEVLGTLLHEMVHQYIAVVGKSSRNGYHNQAWAEAMLAVGLEPVALDAKGNATGKQTGQSATHKIIPDGRAEKAFQKLIDAGWKVPAKFSPAMGAGKPVAARPKMHTYTCPECGESVKGKEGISIICGECAAPMV